MAKPRVERRLAAILRSHVAGYSRLMGADEEGTHEALKVYRHEIIDPKIAEHRGRDRHEHWATGLLARVQPAWWRRCAGLVEVQRGMGERNAEPVRR